MQVVNSHILVFVFASSPLAYVDPLHCNLTAIFCTLLRDALNEYAYAAEIAGISYAIDSTIYGLEVYGLSLT